MILLTTVSGTGIITKSELKYFYTAFMDVGKLGEKKLDEITNNAFHALTSVTMITHAYTLGASPFHPADPQGIT